MDNHRYEIEWPGAHPDSSDCVYGVIEVCVMPGHGEHTRAEQWNAETYPHIYELPAIEAPTAPAAPGQMAAWA